MRILGSSDKRPTQRREQLPVTNYKIKANMRYSQGENHETRKRRPFKICWLDNNLDHFRLLRTFWDKFTATKDQSGEMVEITISEYSGLSSGFKATFEKSGAIKKTLKFQTAISQIFACNCVSAKKI